MTEAFAKVLADHEESHPVFCSLLREVLRLYPPVSNALLWISHRDQARCWDDAEFHLTRLVRARAARGITVSSLARSFVTLCADYIREQAYLARHGAYRESSNAALIESLYHNENEMSSYMEGLFVSTFMWKNHYLLFRFYRERFLPRVFADSSVAPEGIDVGPGHGLFFVMALGDEARPAGGVGVDISPASLAMTSDLACAYGIADDDFELVRHNVEDRLPFDNGRFTYAVSGEVLEHISKPEHLLRELRRVTRAGGPAFVTSVVNAAARDHIYLFRSEPELADMIRAAGWAIEERLVLEVPLPDFLRRADMISQNCAYVLV